MDYHHHARLTVHGRELLARVVVEGRLGLCEAAAEHKLSRQSAAKWVRRFREHGVAGLVDRSSRPQRLREPTPEDRVRRVEALRRERWTGFRIASQTGLSRATVSRILRRLKLSRIRDLEPRPPVQRYEHAAPGDLLHLDIKRLVKIARPSHRVTGDRRDTVHGIGAEYVHVAIDDHSRIAFSAIYPDETRASVLGFLDKALAYYARLGIRFKAVLTDNGASYRSCAFAHRMRQLGLKHRRTRPYTPRTNGKAERFIQTALREWAYARTYQNSAEREQSLAPWIHQYNWHRPHVSLGLSPPIRRAGFDDNNLLTLHTSEVGQRFFTEVNRLAKRFMSDEHFTVDGTLIQAWASQKSFRRKDGSEDGDGTNFGGQKRSHETHPSTTDPESRLYKKSYGKESKLAYLGHALVENRNRPIASAMATQADGHAERDAALLMLNERQTSSSRRITVGADKAYDTKDFIAGARALNVTAHVQKNEKGRRSNVDGSTTRHAGYAISLSRRWLVEKTFGWLKQTGPLAQVKLRGLANVDWVFAFSCAAHNLLRLPRLIASQTQQSPQQKCA